ncbi:MAG: hypothetical protein AB7G62_13240 [Magnetospirillum sp.]
MATELSLARFVTHLRMAGHDFDAIALALATGAVDALVAAGFRGQALDGGLLRVVEAMWDHLGELHGPPPEPPPPPSASAAPTSKPRSHLTLLTGITEP